MSDNDNVDKVVFLKYSSPSVQGDMMAFFACAHCRNKTYTLTEDIVGKFPLLRCAACGKHMGRMGWAPDAGEEG